MSDAATRWHVYKFGGTSLADRDCFRRVAALVEERADRGPCAIVVSAMGGMTDALLGLVRKAEEGANPAPDLDALVARYEVTAACLLAPSLRGPVLEDLHSDQRAIVDVLNAVRLIGDAPRRTRDIVAGFGELWSARLLSALLSAGRLGRGRVSWLDTRTVITVTETALGPSVAWDESAARLQDAMATRSGDVMVVTGFIARDEQGKQTTLGRNGSDHSAAIMGALLAADGITIWTDVPGVMSGDPRKVPDARVIHAMSYNEAMELAYFGARVIHPQTMGPAVRAGVPIFIRSTFEPALQGTCIGAEGDSDESIKGITSIGDLAVVNVEGAGMIGVPGTAHRIFAALRSADISVILISQASSEHSLCVVVPAGVAGRARDVVSGAFASELEEGQLQAVSVHEECSVIAVVGDRMSGTPGVAGRFLGALGAAGINAIAIAQGSSERNISVVVPGRDATRAVRAVHSGFYLSAKTLSIGVIGPGTVGGALLAQLSAQADTLREQFNLDLRVRALSRSRRMVLAERRVDLARWQDSLEREGREVSLDAFTDHVAPDHLPHAVIVDCTADERIVEHYAQWVRRGIHVVTPNKRAFSGELSRLEAIRTAAADSGAQLLYETTVGAALPVIQTLQDLRATGDRVHEVEGIVSGTLAYLFNLYDGTQPFSTIVREACAAGFTEPDPRDDLSGMDVARKMVILARELGYDTELSEVSVESLVPPGLEQLDVAAFLDALPDSDSTMLARLHAARENGGCLRYIARLDQHGRIDVALRAIPDSDTFARLELTDNLFRIRSDRYATNPLVIQGPGAGPQVTAAGIFADLLRLAGRLRGPA